MRPEFERLAKRGPREIRKIALCSRIKKLLIGNAGFAFEEVRNQVAMLSWRPYLKSQFDLKPLAGINLKRRFPENY